MSAQKWHLGNRPRSQAEDAPQSPRPATVAWKPEKQVLAPRNSISHAAHTKSMMHFYLPCRGETLVVVRKKQVGNCSSDRDLEEGAHSLTTIGGMPGCSGEEVN